jgi:7-cyano-7-deazaguanine synthase in queuosine biosynthesis
VRIDDLRSEKLGDRARISATVTFEDNDRPPFVMHFDWLGAPTVAAPDAHPFLLASILPAWRRRERRVLVEGTVCPRLRDGLRAAIQLLARWWEVPGEPPPVEATGGFTPYPERRERAGLFLTGGVDSTHMLNVNRRFYPAEHPASFREAVYTVHLSFLEYAHERTARTIDLAERQSRVVTAISKSCGISLTFLESNFRLIDQEAYLVAPQDQGILLAAAGHVLTSRIGSMSLAASLDINFLPRWGTHPLLDPLYSSSGLEFRHETAGYTRFEKVAEIADWEVARRNLLVCFEGPLPTGKLNCGDCEKCLRTMTALLAVGALDRFAAFSGDRVTAEKIERMDFGHLEFFEWLWKPMVDPLRRRGEHEIARAIDRKLAAARRLEGWFAERDWRGRLRRLDRRLLGGAVLRLSRRLRGLPESRRA